MEASGTPGVRRRTLCGLDVKTFTSEGYTTYVSLSGIQAEVGQFWTKRQRFLDEMGWVPGEDYVKQSTLFTDPTGKDKGTKLWITVPALYQVMFRHRPKAKFCRVVAAQGEREVWMTLFLMIREVQC